MYAPSIWTGLALGAALGGAPEGGSTVPARMAELPVTVIVLDDIGHEFLDAAQTPVIDALAAEGILFTQAWAYPLCSAARAALVTGRHGFRTGIGTAIKHDQTSVGLPLDEVTIAELLPEPCETYGKWHLGPRPSDPTDQGFDLYSGCRWNLGQQGGTGYYKYVKTVGGVDAIHKAYATTDTTDDALQSTASFRLVSYHAAHTPFQPPPGSGGGTSYELGIQTLEFLDREIGRLLADYDGYVFLFSDNGSIPQMGGNKFTLLEGGIRVPFLIHGPGIVPAVRDDLVSIVDVVATVAEMRGVPCPAEDSVSMVPIMLGLPGTRRTVYSEKFHPNHTLDHHERVIRNREYKLKVKEDGSLALFSMPGAQPVQPPYDDYEAAQIRFLFESLPR